MTKFFVLVQLSLILFQIVTIVTCVTHKHWTFRNRGESIITPTIQSFTNAKPVVAAQPKPAPLIVPTSLDQNVRPLTRDPVVELSANGQMVVKIPPPIMPPVPMTFQTTLMSPTSSIASSMLSQRAPLESHGNAVAAAAALLTSTLIPTGTVAATAPLASVPTTITSLYSSPRPVRALQPITYTTVDNPSQQKSAQHSYTLALTQQFQQFPTSRTSRKISTSPVMSSTANRFQYFLAVPSRNNAQQPLMTTAISATPTYQLAWGPYGASYAAIGAAIGSYVPIASY